MIALREADVRTMAIKPIRALLSRLLRPAQVLGAVQKRDMREGLREIPNLPRGADIIFLGEQAHIVPQGEEAFEQLSGFINAAHQDVDIDQPEAASQKCTFACRQAIGCFRGIVAQDESIDEEASLDRFHRSTDPSVGHRQEA